MSHIRKLALFPAFVLAIAACDGTQPEPSGPALSADGPVGLDPGVVPCASRSKAWEIGGHMDLDWGGAMHPDQLGLICNRLTPNVGQRFQFDYKFATKFQGEVHFRYLTTIDNLGNVVNTQLGGEIQPNGGALFSVDHTVVVDASIERVIFSITHGDPNEYDHDPNRELNVHAWREPSSNPVLRSSNDSLIMDFPAHYWVRKLEQACSGSAPQTTTVKDTGTTWHFGVRNRNCTYTATVYFDLSAFSGLPIVGVNGPSDPDSLMPLVSPPFRYPVRVETPILDAATQNVSYTKTLEASGGWGARRWSATGLPTGFSIDIPTGVISGTTANVGTYPVVVTVTDEVGSASRELTLVVNSQSTTLLDIMIVGPDVVRSTSSCRYVAQPAQWDPEEEWVPENYFFKWFRTDDGGSELLVSIERDYLLTPPYTTGLGLRVEVTKRGTTERDVATKRVGVGSTLSGRCFT